jgi:hypothetical protein
MALPLRWPNHEETRYDKISSSRRKPGSSAFLAKCKTLDSGFRRNDVLIEPPLEFNFELHVR